MCLELQRRSYIAIKCLSDTTNVVTCNKLPFHKKRNYFKNYLIYSLYHGFLVSSNRTNYITLLCAGDCVQYEEANALIQCNLSC